MSETSTGDHHSDAIEQLLGLTGDPSWVEQFMSVEAGSAAAAAFVGRVLGAAKVLDPRSPLAHWAGLGQFASDWRQHHSITPGSITDELIARCRAAGLTVPASGITQYRLWCALTGAEPDMDSRERETTDRGES